MAKFLVASCAALLAVGCATQTAATPAKTPTAGQVLAAIACPMRVAKADAWVNMMPGASRTLHVAVQLDDPAARAVIIKSDVNPPGALNLEIRASDAAPFPGRVTYSEPFSDPPVQRIGLMCRGGEIAAITKIEQVY